QAWKGDGKGGTDIGFGASVYPAAYVLAEYLERHPDLVRGKRVIELGESPLPPPHSTLSSICKKVHLTSGAASVCLTDGDDGSLRLAERNVEANLPPTIGQHPRAPPRDRPAKETFKNTTTTNQSSSIASISCHNDNGMNTTRVIEVDRDDCAVTKAHHQRQRAPRAVSVRKLRWGFPDDMEACLGKGGPWEVVLGSDIAALPYASAHGDLLRTIAFLVNGGSAAALDSENAAAEVHAENATEVERENGTELTVKNANKFEGENGTEFEVESGTKVQDESGVELHAEISTEDRGGEGKGRKVLVLLAHKRRHVCEEPFFEGLRAELGESSCREMGEGDVHPDFRDMGIRLLAFEVDVCRRASGHKT
ncbi:unnamed protein product, partial [Laminaria digitata]